MGETRTELNISSQANVERVRESPDEDTANCEVGWVSGWDFVLKQRTNTRAAGTVGGHRYSSFKQLSCEYLTKFF